MSSNPNSIPQYPAEREQAYKDRAILFRMAAMEHLAEYGAVGDTFQWLFYTYYPKYVSMREPIRPSQRVDASISAKFIVGHTDPLVRIVMNERYNLNTKHGKLILDCTLAPNNSSVYRYGFVHTGDDQMGRATTAPIVRAPGGKLMYSHNDDTTSIVPFTESDRDFLPFGNPNLLDDCRYALEICEDAFADLRAEPPLYASQR